MTRTVTVLAVLSALAAGCHYARGVGYAETIAPGRPEFFAGEPEGYWIWQDGQGWHLRTTSDAPRHFHGVVDTMGAAPSTVRAVGGTERALRTGGSLIEFDYEAAGGEHGFDWGSSSGCNRFDLFIDGTTRPLRVFLGGVEDNPARVPFAVCG